MGAFLSVARGSAEVPWFLELRLNVPEGQREGQGEGEEGERPLMLVGKGRVVKDINFYCGASACV